VELFDLLDNSCFTRERIVQRVTVLRRGAGGKRARARPGRIDGSTVAVKYEQVGNPVMVGIPDRPRSIAVGVKIIDLINVTVKICIRLPTETAVDEAGKSIGPAVKTGVFDDLRHRDADEEHARQRQERERHRLSPHAAESTPTSGAKQA